MIDQVLHTLSSELNIHLRRQGGIEADLSMVAGPKDPNDNEAQDRLVLTVVNVEQEKLQRVRNHLGHDLTATSPPALHGLNLYVLVKSDFSDYRVALKRLSEAISFFHERPMFNPENTPDLPAVVERVVVEHQNMDLETASFLWKMLAEPYVPAVLYKVRLFVGEADQIESRI